MKMILFYLFFIPCISLAAKSMDIHQVRENYPLAVDNKKICKTTLNALIHMPQSAIVMVYLGAYQAMLAKHLFNPIEKLNSFSKGKKNIEKAVTMAPNSLEVRFIRLSIQANSPRILNYRSAIEVDKNYVIKGFSSIENNQLKNLVQELSKSSTVFTPDEKKQLK